MLCRLVLVITAAFLLFQFHNLKVEAEEEIIEVEHFKPKSQKKKTLRGEIIKYFDEDFIDQPDENLNGDIELKVLEMIKNEPKLSEVQEAALKYAAIPNANEFEKFRKLAKRRNLLPRVSYGIDQGRYRQSQGDLSYIRDVVTPNRGSLSPNGTYNNSTYETELSNSFNGFHRIDLQGSITFNLPDAVYDDEITDILSEQRRFATIRSDYMDQIYNVYIERRRKKIALVINPPKSRIQRILSEIDIHELDTKLDSLTGGWFTRNLGRKAIKAFSQNP